MITITFHWMMQTRPSPPAVPRSRSRSWSPSHRAVRHRPVDTQPNPRSRPWLDIGDEIAAVLANLDGAAFEAAASKLAEPSHNTATTLGIGIGAISQSLPAVDLPRRRAETPRSGATQTRRLPLRDRRQPRRLLHRAANLALGLDSTDELFEEAMRRAADAFPLAR
jgi:hypothetical protein